MGFFNEDYICRTDVAVVYDPSGRIRAFANLWKNVNKEELSIDLMRYDPESPSGIMEYLFVELMLWGKTENYQLVFARNGAACRIGKASAGAIMA